MDVDNDTLSLRPFNELMLFNFFTVPQPWKLLFQDRAYSLYCLLAPLLVLFNVLIPLLAFVVWDSSHSIVLIYLLRILSFERSHVCFLFIFKSVWLQLSPLNIIYGFSSHTLPKHINAGKFFVEKDGFILSDTMGQLLFLSKMIKYHHCIALI